MQLKYKVIQSSRIQWQQENKVHLSAAKKSSRGNDSKGSKETIKNNCNCIYNKVISTTTLRAAEDVLGSARILVTGRKRWAQSLKCIEDTLGNVRFWSIWTLLKNHAQCQTMMTLITASLCLSCAKHFYVKKNPTILSFCWKFENCRG